MPYLRGFVYEIEAAAHPSPETAAALVLTSDDWNEHMLSVGAVLVVRQGSRSHLPAFGVVPLYALGLDAVPGHIVSLEHEHLGSKPLYRIEDEELRAVERALSEVLGLPDVLSAVPRRPYTPGGPTRYPLWGQVYYGPGRPERKRYLVVSANPWNRSADRVLTIRLTTSARRVGTEFPHVRGGRACCAELTALRSARFTPRERVAPDLTKAEMVAIARGLVETHRLEGALGGSG